MVQIRNVEREVQAQTIGPVYENGNVPSGAFGENVTRSLDKATQTVINAGKVVKYEVDQWNEKADNINALEFQNSIREWEQEKLYSENGYFNQQGKNASGKSGEIMKDFEEWASKKEKDLRMHTSKGQTYLKAIYNQENRRISRGVHAHDLKQTDETIKTEVNLRINNLMQQGIASRNDADGIESTASSLAYAVVDYGKARNYDDNQIKAMQQKSLSEYYSAVVTSLAKEKNLNCVELLEKCKDKIDAETFMKLKDTVYAVEMDVEARQNTSNYMIMGLTLEQADAEAEKITDLNKRDAQIQRNHFEYNRKESNEKKAYDDNLQNVWDKVVQSKNIDDIPTDGTIRQVDIEKLKNYCVNGSPTMDDANAFFELKEKQIYDADAFATLNLNDYRDKLTDKQLQTFFIAQQNIKQHGYSTIDSNDERILEVCKQVGIHTGRGSNKGENSVYTLAQKMLTADEANSGRQFNAQEREQKLNEIFSRLGYTPDGNKDLSTFKLLERSGGGAGDVTSVKFFDRIDSGCKYFVKQHGRQPDNSEFNKIVQENVVWLRRQQTKQAVNKALSPETNAVWFEHRITSPYGKRTTPTKGASSDHKGIDLAYQMNEPVRAFASGTVENVVKGSAGYGNYVDIRSADGTIHRYAHTSSISAKKGDKVIAGQTIIAQAGMSGTATGPHVHYEKIKNGKSVDPLETSGGWDL